MTAAEALPIALALGLFGLMVGSFLNVCISRLPEHESVAWPGSRCPHCRTPIHWYDNVPVLSYIVLAGRCRSCKVRIGLRYPMVELATAITFAILGVVYAGDLPMLGVRLLFATMLIVLFGTDLETQRLPNVITLPGIVIGLVQSIWLPPGLVDSAIGAAIGAAIPWLIRWLWRRWKGIDAMGLGDVKLLAMIGAFLGWRQVWVVLLLASCTGAIVGIAMVSMKGRSLQTKLPFGTFLAVAALIAALVGERLVTWYLGTL